MIKLPPLLFLLVSILLLLFLAYLAYEVYTYKRPFKINLEKITGFVTKPAILSGNILPVYVHNQHKTSVSIFSLGQTKQLVSKLADLEPKSQNNRYPTLSKDSNGNNHLQLIHKAIHRVITLLI